MSGMSVLLRKELLESWRTMRLPIVAGLFLVVGLTSPLLAKFLPEIITAATGDQIPAIPIPTPVAVDAIDQLWKNLAQFGAFAAIVLAMGSVATERPHSSCPRRSRAGPSSGRRSSVSGSSSRSAWRWP